MIFGVGVMDIVGYVFCVEIEVGKIVGVGVVFVVEIDGIGIVIDCSFEGW